MAVLVNPSNVKVISQNGEVTLALQIELNININANGAFTPNEGPINNKTNVPTVNKTSDDEPTWLVPDFNSNEKIKFGK